MRKDNQIGERDWSKRPLFAGRRRSRGGFWLVLLLMLVFAAGLGLYPNLMRNLMAPLLG